MISPGSPGPAPTSATVTEALLDELAEEVAPRLVGGQVLLRPRPELAQIAREPHVLAGDEPGDVVAQPLGERG